MKALVVLISGGGTNLQAIMDACQDGILKNVAFVKCVVSNRKNAYGLTRATNAGIPTVYFPLKPYKDQGKSREMYDADLADKILKEQNPDLIVLAGWMHILSPNFLDKFPNKVINLHPALPKAFDGANAIERAFTAYQEKTISHTGVMVHYVIPEVDRGEVILTQDVEINDADTLDTLEERIHKVEHTLLVKAIHKICTQDA
eukprot:NODE_1402_length_873_cov_98.359249_g1356_i0.p1 GENE.NODE_1402_length_873_cov_98.359249_g1356_i0~~NODE_1402_length_873_cov_98.359249_g1356_i0.p1  ORF type:complete len:202 (-),score=31.96 NODE_1402_length_873_cov_98.359249_g1356_i0:211-816(-)